jgi:hypothetical protein
MAKVKLPRNMPFPFKEETIRFRKLRGRPIVVTTQNFGKTEINGFF